VRRRAAGALVPEPRLRATGTIGAVTDTTTPAWSGINHLALITPDMDATVRFYHGVLGARLVSTVGTPDFRHYFFEFGPQCTVAFFEYTAFELEPFAKPAGIPDKRAVQFDHLSLNLPDEAALHALRQRLIDHDCEVTEVVDHGTIHSVYFTDPNGIALEASWWVQDVTAMAPGYDDPSRFGDPDPVPALRELLDAGELTTGAGTRLS
jgi:catechol 2,3-dioxygenase-like lactoylglutathione lyase family enzyme